MDTLFTRRYGKFRYSFKYALVVILPHREELPLDGKQRRVSYQKSELLYVTIKRIRRGSVMETRLRVL